MHAKFRPLIKKLGNALLACILLVSWESPAHAIILFTDELFTNESPAYQIGTTKDAAIDPITLYFGDTNSQAITWDTTKFNISGTAAIAGGVSATGQVNFSGSTGFRIREVANQATATCTTINELVLNTANSQIYKCTVVGSPGAWTSTASAAQDLESVYNTDADKVLTTSNSTFTVNTGTNDFVVTSNDWSVNAAGLITASGGATISGGAVNVNTNANQATNINTGTSTGLISVGGGFGTVAINTASWDISSAGVASGFTGLTSTGQVNFSGANGTRIREVANPLVASCAAVGELVLNTADSKIYACTVVGTPGTWSNTGSAVTPDFEGVYTQDADKILTTSNGTFTIAAGTGAVNVNSTTGGISLNNNVNGSVNIATGTSTGAVAVGGGLNTVAVNSSDWDISATGDMTGIGAVTMDGNFSQTGATTFGTGTGAVSLNGTTTVANGSIFTANGGVALGDGGDTVAVNSSDWDIGTTGDMTGIGSISADGLITGTAGTTLSGAAISLNNNSNFPVNIATGTSTGAVAVGGGSNTVAVNSSDWDITTTGTMTGIGAVTMDGLLTGTAGATLSGAAIGLNSNSNFATNINTGTSTGTVSIGGNNNSVAIDSSIWDITGAGIASGFTGITSTGTIDFSGASRLAMTQGAANPGTCTEGDLFYNATDNFTYVCTTTNTWTKVGTSNNDFENVYETDVDKILTTSNGAFTIEAGTGAVAVNSTTGGISLNNNVNGAVNIATGTSTGAVAVGGGSNTVAVNSSDWDISATGDMTGVGAVTMDGLLTGTAGATVTGATINLNNNSNFDVNLGTGTSTGTITLGGTGTQTIAVGSGGGAKTVNMGSSITTSTTNLLSGSGGLNLNVNNNQVTNLGTGTTTGQVNLGGNANCVNVDSNTWNISCAGLATGFTGITSTGNISFAGATTTFRPPTGTTAQEPATCTEGMLYYNTTTHTLRICATGNTWTSAGAAGNQYVFAYDIAAQTVAVANTFQDVIYGTNGQIDGWTHTPGTAIFTANAAGTYMVNMTARIAKSGGANTTLSFIGAKNTTAAPGTFTEITGSQAYGTAAASSGDTMSGNFIVTMAATEILKIRMTGGTTGAQIVGGGHGTVLPSTQISIWRLK